MIGIIICVICTILLITAAIIDFVMAGEQNSKSNKNVLIAAGAMTIIATGIMIIMIIILNMHCPKNTSQIGTGQQISGLTAAILE